VNKAEFGVKKGEYMKSKNIFISYIEEDRKIAEMIAKKLSLEGFSTWAYTINGSVRWKKQVVRELKQCEIMILVFSKKTNDKADKQIVKELGLASEYEKEIIPFMIDEVTPKDITNEEIAYEIVGGSITWIEKEEPVENQIQKLICRVRTYYGEECSNKQENIVKNRSIKVQYNDLATPNTESHILHTLHVSNTGLHTDWQTEILLNSSNLYLNIHYNTGYYGAKNLRVYLDDISKRVYKQNEELIVKAKITADNLGDEIGEAKIKFIDDVKLILKDVMWEKGKCKSFDCVSPIPDNIQNIFSKQGLYLGDIAFTDDVNYNGNIVVRYIVEKVKENKLQKNFTIGNHNYKIF